MNAGTAEMTNQPACACQTASGVTIEDFLNLRKQCDVINKILIPDKILDCWETIASCLEKNASEGAWHQSKLLLAFYRGQLGKITPPLHRFLFNQGQPQLNNQYRQDLQETWFFQSSPGKRHKQSRRYMGKLMELITAGWLEEQKWNVTGLAAWDTNNTGAPDIIAADSQGVRHAIEVKYIGQEDEDFASLLRSLNTGGADVIPLNLYVACNYIWFRIYEAALQIVTRPEAKLAVLVIDATAWDNLNPVLRNNWMPSRNYSFYRAEVQDDCAWKAFSLSSIENRYPGIGNPCSKEFMPTVIKSLSQVRIAVLKNWEISPQFTFAPNVPNHNDSFSLGNTP